jgi:hypothetical protein
MSKDSTVYPYSFRLTSVARDLLEALATRMGLSRKGVVETALRELARQESLYPPRRVKGETDDLAS